MGGGAKGETKASKKGMKMAQRFEGEGREARGTLLDQWMEGLTTGGVGARIPIVSKAEEASRQATSNALRALEGQLAQTGQAGTPFGTRALAETTQRGEQATAGIGPGMTAQFLAGLPNFLLGQATTATQGMGNVMQGQAGQAGAEAAWLQAMMSPFNPMNIIDPKSAIF